MRSSPPNCSSALASGALSARPMRKALIAAGLVIDLIDGQYSDPARIIAFNTAEGWSRDVSSELADEIAQRCGVDGFDNPPSLQNFVAQYATLRSLQLPLSLSKSA
jgi:hypothetical protein